MFSALQYGALVHKGSRRCGIGVTTLFSLCPWRSAVATGPIMVCAFRPRANRSPTTVHLALKAPKFTDIQIEATGAVLTAPGMLQPPSSSSSPSQAHTLAHASGEILLALSGRISELFLYIALVDSLAGWLGAPFKLLL